MLSFILLHLYSCLCHVHVSFICSHTLELISAIYHWAADICPHTQLASLVDTTLALGTQHWTKNHWPRHLFSHQVNPSLVDDKTSSPGLKTWDTCIHLQATLSSSLWLFAVCNLGGRPGRSGHVWWRQVDRGSRYTGEVPNEGSQSPFL